MAEQVRQITHPDFSEEERDILQELVNIAFGKASADLAQVIDIYVVLNVPYIELISAVELPDYIADGIGNHPNVSIVEQNFLGRFNGIALLIFPGKSERELFRILERQDNPDGDFSLDTLERETLMEVGNILIGACVGKVAELLRDVVSYAPPRVIVENSPREAVSSELFDQQAAVVVMKTVFSFEQRAISGYLFLINDGESLSWLKTALHRFLDQYE